MCSSRSLQAYPHKPPPLYFSAALSPAARRAAANRHRRRVRKAHSSHPTERLAWDDGRHLAADPSVGLPSDGYRNKPRLERQEAFRAPKTSRSWRNLDYVDDDDDLYRMGLLYDDSNDRSGSTYGDRTAFGSRFTLSSIVHSEPAYTITVSRRARRSYEPHLSAVFLDKYSDDDDDEHVEYPFLTLDLSFTSLSHNVDVAMHGDGWEAEMIPDDLSIHPAGGDPPPLLDVISELPGSSCICPMTPITQVPELVSDGEDEFDDDSDWFCLNDDGETCSIVGAVDGVGNTLEDENAIAAADEAWMMLGDGS